MADRGAAPPADAGRPPETIRLQAADRQGQGNDLRTKFGACLRHRCKGKTERDPVGLHNEVESEISCRRRESVEYTIRVDKNLKCLCDRGGKRPKPERSEGVSSLRFLCGLYICE